MARQDDQLDENAPPIEVKNLRSAFGDNIIHDGLNLTIQRGDVVGVAAIIDLPGIGGAQKLRAAGLPVHALCEFSETE